MKTEFSINYNATSIEEASEYLRYRCIQLGKFGIIPDKMVYENNSIILRFKEDDGAIYVLKNHRGKGLFKKQLDKYHLKKIITLEECNVDSYLNKNGIEYQIYSHSPAYKLIQNIYGDRRAKRSGVPLIYHIDEGGSILHSLGANNVVKDAYYIHPLLQSDEDFIKNKNNNFRGINTESLILATEYRRVANSYLSTMDKKGFVGLTCEEIRQMLIADKVQNFKDFMEYHYESHERSDELYEYFNNWFDILEIDCNNFINIILWK